MEEILTSVFVPAIQKTYDVFLPVDLEIKELTGLLAKGIAETDSMAYTYSGREMLIPKGAFYPLNPKMSLADYAFCNGVELILL